MPQAVSNSSPRIHLSAIGRPSPLQHSACGLPAATALAGMLVHPGLVTGFAHRPRTGGTQSTGTYKYALTPDPLDSI